MKLDLKEEIIKAYIKCQKASGLKVGDKVKVTKEVTDHTDGWPNCWVEEMTAMIGGTYTIKYINSEGDITLSEGGWGFPYFVLEKIPPIKWEVLDMSGKWKKSLNQLSVIRNYEKLNSDDKYYYRHNFEMLYRLKKE